MKGGQSYGYYCATLPLGVAAFVASQEGNNMASPGTDSDVVVAAATNLVPVPLEQMSKEVSCHS